MFLTVIESDKYVLVKEIIGFLIVTLAVIWNFESGIICCIAFAVFEVIVFIQDYKFSIKTVMSAMLKIIFWVLTPVVCAWGIVNFYNILCNAELLGMSSFIGMAVNTEYIEQLEATLEWGNKTYLHKIMVFLICFCWGITYIKCDRRNGNRVKANYAVTTAILGLGLSVYFINRPLATDNLVNIFFVICIGLLAGGMVETIKNWADLKYMEIYTLMKCIAGLYAIWVLILCGLRGFGVYQDFVVAYETGAYDYEDFKKLTYKIEESIPKDTWAIGEGMSAIYMELGWEKGTWGFASTQVEDILMQDQVFVSSSQYGYVLQEYRLICEFTYGDMVFGYFEREA